MRSGKSLSRMVPSQIAVARTTAFSNSRMFPGQGYFSKSRSASIENVTLGLKEYTRSAKLFASSRISSGRSRNGGNLIEQDSSFIRLLPQSSPVAVGPGERAFDMTE